MVYIFKTDITTKAAIKKLAPSLEKISAITKWNFDLLDRDNILRIEACEFDTEIVCALLKSSGHLCAELFSIFLPRKVAHAWTQVSEKGKMSVILQPAGKLENFFITMAALDHEPSQQEIVRIFSDNDMQVVGPPLKMG